MACSENEVYLGKWPIGRGEVDFLFFFVFFLFFLCRGKQMAVIP